ncbi:hypothetical protein [Hamadaea tsunoensis]|uniref:hypothetical protein n=1 Tax=Hamadaea tsunoensis TaxID=53368 RepID=UPI0012F9808F|nr:hypothetical protein [Hamadaea tsunoensis]
MLNDQQVTGPVKAANQMPLRPANEDLWITEIRGVRIYLDDVENMASELGKYGTAEVTVSHRGRPDSIYDSIDDLIGRKDVYGVSMRVENPKGQPWGYTELDLGMTGVRVRMAGKTIVPRSIVEHFLSSLERRRFRLLSPLIGNYAEIVTDKRLSKLARTDQRRHDLKLALISGVIGAAIGAVATIIGAVIAK